MNGTKGKGVGTRQSPVALATPTKGKETIRLIEKDPGWSVNSRKIHTKN